MQGKSFVRFFTIALILVTAYIFLLMLPTGRIERQAREYAEGKTAGIKDANDKLAKMEIEEQFFLDSIADESVLNLGIKSYTYSELKRNQLGLGLDLKGGMSVVMQVNLEELISQLAGGSTDPIFLKAIENARKAQANAQVDFVTLFGQEYAKIASGKPLARLFIASDKMSGVSVNSTDAQVIEAIRKEASATVNNTYNLLKQRIDKFGVVSPTVSLDKTTDRITVELPGIKSPQRARRMLQATAKLEFWEMYTGVELLGQQVAGPWIQLNDALKVNKEFNDNIDTAKATVVDSQALAKVNSIKADTTLDQVKKDSLLAGIDTMKTVSNDSFGPLFKVIGAIPPQQETDPFYAMAKPSDTAKVMRMLNSEDARRIMPRDVRFVWDAKPQPMQDGSRMFRLFALKTKGAETAPLSGERVTSSYPTSNSSGMGYAVSLEMDSDGARAWKKMTENNVNRCVAVVLDDKVQSWPRVNEVIPNGRTQISGNFSATEATDLSNILSIGKLPATPEIIEEAIVGPSLGQETVNAGLFALLGGFLLVLVFMLGYYAFGGLLSVIVLFLNIFIIFGCLASFGTVLTLPGIAGIVLTIGMAVDANVIIYERIREELRKDPDAWKTGVIEGFKNSYSSIIDANVTTFVTALILFVYGLGPIKGFATVLAIGVVSSVFTAVLVSRLIFDYYLTRNQPVSVWTNATKNVLANPKIDFMKLRKMSYLISGAIILAGIISIAVRGFELGVDFQGGRSYTVEFAQKVKINEYKEQLSKAMGGYELSSVKAFGKDNQVKVTTSWQQENTNNKEADAKVLRAVRVASESYAGFKNPVADEAAADSIFAVGKPQNAKADGVYLLASSKVGATIADDITQSAFLASALSLAFIFFYILIRFRKWQFSLGAIVALAHDVMIVVGLFSLLRGLTSFSLEIDQHFVAAILTIIGYSINDTVIVYDRIREEATLTPNDPLKDVINRSINSTLSRTSFTSLTTWIVVAVLFLFGGSGIAGFAFALFVGIAVGTYSSIFIASPIIVDTTKDATAFAFKSDEDEIDMRGEETVAPVSGEETPKV